MSKKLSADTINQSLPEWQHPIVPGQAVQGSILITTTDFKEPPQSQSNFIWLTMEDVIGVAAMRLDYVEAENLYILYKAKGHLTNDGEWNYTWEVVGQWHGITEEVQEALKKLKYVEYKYDTTIPNTLKVTGVLKDGVEELLVDISFASYEEFQTAITTLSNRLNQEITRATNKENELEDAIETETNRAVARENELQAMIEAATMNPGRAIEVTTNKVINVLYDNDSIKLNNSNQLKADVFNDTEVRNDKGWSSAKISQEMVGAMHYKGQVPTYADLPTTGMQAGDLYNVEDTGDNYAWNGTSWDKQSGDYIAGAGIDITGKIIKATGIAFAIGDGLETEGSGDNIILKVKSNNNLTQTNKAPVVIDSQGGHIKVNNNAGLYQPQGSNAGIGIKVKSNNGLNLDSTGLGININSDTLKVYNNTIGVKIKENAGLEIDEDSNNGIGFKAGYGLSISPDGGDVQVAVNGNSITMGSGGLETVLKTWTGTQAEYDAIVNKDSNTIYMIHE